MWNCTWSMSPALLADQNTVVNKDPVLALESSWAWMGAIPLTAHMLLYTEQNKSTCSYTITSPLPIAAQHSSDNTVLCLGLGSAYKHKGRNLPRGNPRRDPSRVDSSPPSTPSETCSSAAQVCTDPVDCPVLIQVFVADRTPDWGVSRVCSRPWSPFAA